MPSLAVDTRTLSCPTVGRTPCRNLRAEDVRKCPDAPESPTAVMTRGPPAAGPPTREAAGNQVLTWLNGKGTAVVVGGVGVVGCTCRADWREEEDGDGSVWIIMCFLTIVKKRLSARRLPPLLNSLARCCCSSASRPPRQGDLPPLPPLRGGRGGGVAGLAGLGSAIPRILCTTGQVLVV